MDEEKNQYHSSNKYQINEAVVIEGVKPIQSLQAIQTQIVGKKEASQKQAEEDKCAICYDSYYRPV